jgi:hypothetical protein
METSQVSNLWQYYNVHLIWPDKDKERLTVTALSNEDAYKDGRVINAISLGAYVLTVRKCPSEASPKQKLARQYGFTIGCAMAVSSHINAFERQVNLSIKDEVTKTKVFRAIGLARMQATKLDRDIRDMFRAAGIKIKAKA